jgi:hypothetical protein
MMRLRMTIATPFVALLVAGLPASGQKPPRTAPTAADWSAQAKLPDLTGVWEAGRAAAAPAGPAAPQAAAPAANGAAAGGRGAGRGAAPAAPGGGRGRGAAAGPSLTPEYAAKAKQPTPPAASGEQAANCLPPGLPGIMTQPYPYEFLMTPGQVTIISEAYAQARHILTDGRALPQDPDPTFYGTSVGKWEDGILVVETIGFAQVPRGLNFPYSDKLKITERFKLTGPDTMTVETTVTDPEALTAPYALAARTLQRHRSWTLQEYVCEENNRNFVDSNGNSGVKLANPLSSAK